MLNVLSNKNEEVHCMEIPCSVNQILALSPSVGHKIRLWLFFFYTVYKKYSQVLQGLLTRVLHRGMLCVMIHLTSHQKVKCSAKELNCGLIRP